MSGILTAAQVLAIEQLSVSGAPHEKFCADPQRWASRAVDRVEILGLDRADRQWILDVGCGIPYFAWAAHRAGHDVLSLDMPSPTIEKAAAILDCQFIPYRVSARDPLPRLPHRFDFITMFGVNLNHEDGRDYSANEFGQVVLGLFQRLVPGGWLVVGPNHGFLGDLWKHLAWWSSVFPSDIAGTKKLAGNVVTIKAR